jgi:L-asparaginase II
MHVERRRGDTPESRHEVHVAVTDTRGRLVGRAGDPDLVTFWRSAAKPFQAMPLVTDGGVAAFGLSEEDLALTCASHSSEPRQVELVRRFLAKIGCRESDLLCGPHAPLSDAVARDYRAQGVTLTAIHSNCSGKHTGMLALAKHHGWPTAGYVAAGHPVQRRCLEEVSRWSGIAPGDVKTGIDGCGVLCFALPLRAMALAYTKLGTDPHAAPVAIVRAMLAHPELIAGEGRPCTEVMRAFPGRVIAKVGAEGVYSALLVKEGIGIALKVADGHTVAAALALGAVLSELGLGSPPPGLAARPIRNSRGLEVGDMRVIGGLAQ